jgi:hypothetical protein
MIYTPRPRHKLSSAASRAPVRQLRSFATTAAAAAFIIQAQNGPLLGDNQLPNTPFFYVPRRPRSPQTLGILGKCRNGLAAEMKNRAAI